MKISPEWMPPLTHPTCDAEGEEAAQQLLLTTEIHLHIEAELPSGHSGEILCSYITMVQYQATPTLCTHYKKKCCI